MKQENVAVTGLGVIASNGGNVREFFENCLRGQRGITDSPCPFFDTGKLRTPFWAQVTQKRNPSANAEKNIVYRARHFAKLAADEAMADAGLTKADIASLGTRTAIVTGSLSYDDYHILEAAKYQNSAGMTGSPAYLAKLSDFAPYIKAYCGVGGACYNFSAACASGSTEIGIGRELIRSGICDIVLVCGVDSLSQMVAYGFHSLKALSSGLCHPLDTGRDGINIGEGCGFLILESFSHAQNRQAKIYAACIGHSLGNEAFHITSPDTDADGFYRSMQTAIEDAGLTPSDMDYINLHGTGTIANDQIELQALNRLYHDADKRPYISSLKTLIGHCMGAAGALEAILTILCLKQQRYFPILEVTNPMEEMAGWAVTPPARPMKYALSNSFAFAGNTASVVFRQYLPDEIPDKAHDKPCSDGSKQEVWINGLGILSPAITDTAAWKTQLFEAAPAGVRTQPVGTPTPGIPAKKLRGVNHLSRMVLSTSLQAEQDSRCDHTLWDAERTGTFYSSGYGAVSARLRFGREVAAEQPDLCNPTVFANISPNAPVGHLCICLNCKGASSSLHGASPLLLSAMQIQAGTCDTVFSCMAEEYEPLLAESLAAAHIIPEQEYEESSITLLLQNKQSASSYCRIEDMRSCDLSHREELQRIPCVPDVIITQDTNPAIEKPEKTWLKKLYPNSRLLSAKEITGKLLNNSLYANIALAAVCLKQNAFPESLFPDAPAACRQILVTGYDVCENYHQILLSSKERSRI